MFDAILFHQRSLTLRDLPDKRKRRPEQRYVHWSFEAPVYSFHDLTDLKYLSNFFNWSMSYRQDSEFPVPYGAIEKVRHNFHLSVSMMARFFLGLHLEHES